MKFFSAKVRESKDDLIICLNNQCRKSRHCNSQVGGFRVDERVAHGHESFAQVMIRAMVRNVDSVGNSAMRKQCGRGSQEVSLTR